jgi:hypothetical protein
MYAFIVWAYGWSFSAGKKNRPDPVRLFILRERRIMIWAEQYQELVCWHAPAVSSAPNLSPHLSRGLNYWLSAVWATSEVFFILQLGKCHSDRSV